MAWCEDSDPTVGAVYDRTALGNDCALIERTYRKRGSIAHAEIPIRAVKL
jgi:hypothetical protein